MIKVWKKTYANQLLPAADQDPFDPSRMTSKPLSKLTYVLGYFSTKNRKSSQLFFIGMTSTSDPEHFPKIPLSET